MILIFDGVLYTEHIPLPRFIRDTGNLKNLKNHCTYVRTVSSLSALKFIYSEKATKFLRNLSLTFDYSTYGQKLGEDFAKFSGLLRIYELYLSLSWIDI